MTFERVSLGSHSWDAPAPAVSTQDQPHPVAQEVLGHVERMAQTGRPAQYTELQWHGLLRDLRSYAERWLEQSLAAGWNLMDIYGSPPRHNGRVGLMGVALLLRGCTIESIEPSQIVIANHSGPPCVWRKQYNGTAAPHRMAGAKLIWKVPIMREYA